MRFRSVRVNGLGMLADTAIDSISENLVVIEGPNGAGKSTFLEFVNSLLFGFPMGKGSNKFLDTLGGLRGGSAEVETADGRALRMERAASEKAAGSLLIQQNGVAVEGAALIGSVDRSLYDSVFAINLEDLREAITGDLQTAVEAAITGMRVTGLPNAIKKTEAETKELQKQLKALSEELTAIDSRLKTAKAETRRYDQFVDEAHQVSATLIELQEQLVPARQAATRLARLQRAWPAWCEYVAARSALENLPDPSDFDPGAEERLGNLREQETRLRRNIEEATAEIALQREQFGQLELAPTILMNAESIEPLAGKVQAVRESELSLPSKIAEVETALHTLQERLADLGARWDVERLDRFDASVPAQSESQRAAKAVEIALSSVGAAETEIAGVEREFRESREVLNELESRVSKFGDSRDFETLDRQARSLNQIRDAFQTIERLRGQLAASPSAASTREIDTKLWVLLGAIALVVAGAAIAARAYALLAIIPLLAAFVWLLLRPKAGSAASQGANDVLSAEMARAKRQVEELADREDWLVSSVADLDTVDAEIQREREKAKELQSLKALIEDAKRRLEMSQVRLSEAEQRALTARDLLEQRRAEWAAHCGQRDLPTDLEPEALPRFETAVRAAKDARAALRQAETTVDSLRVRAAAAEKEIDAVYAGVGLARAGASLSHAIELLVSKLRSAHAADTKASAAEQEIGRQERAVKAWSSELAGTGEEIQKLFDRYAVQTDAEFEAALRDRERARETQAQLEKARAALASLGGPSDGGASLIKELESLTNEFDLNEETAAAERRRIDLEEAFLQAKEQSDRLRWEIESLESSAVLGGALAEHAALQAEIESIRGKWLDAVLAKILLEEAKAKFQDQVQTSVFDRASHYMREFTDGQSETIRKEEDSYVLVDKGGRTRSLSQLNRSHSERLLLALRFAYIDHYSEKKEPLPVVLDDILVNFDPEFQRLAAKTIQDFASRHQVLYLTCHPSTVRLFESSGMPFQHVRLEQWKFQAPSAQAVGAKQD